MIDTNFKKIGKQLDAIGIKLQKRAQRHPTALKRVFSEFGRRVRNSIIYSMYLDPKTGHIYKYKGRKYRASAPGESPAVRSGKLIKAISYTVRKNQVEVGALKRAFYAHYLEPGTDEGLRNRPFLMVNVEKHLPYLRGELMKEMIVSALVKERRIF